MSGSMLERLGWLDLLPEAPITSGDARFLREFFLPARGRYRKRPFEAALAKAKAPAVRGRLLRILGRTDEARAELARAKKDPRAAAFLAELDLVAAPEQAAEALGKAAPAFEPARVWRAYALFLSGREDQAAAVLRKAGLSSATGLILRGILAERRDDVNAAEADFSAVAERFPDCPGIFTLRGNARWRLGRKDEAIEDAHRSVDLHPENMDTFVRIIYLAAGKKADPAREREILLAELEKLDGAWVDAVKAAVLGSSALQLEPLRRSVSREPGRAWVRAFLGRCLGDPGSSRADKEKGLAELDEAERLAPKRGWISAWRAEVLKQLGRKKDALAALDRGIRLDPDYRLALSWRATLRQERGDRKGALADLSLCLEALERPGFLQRRAALEWGAKPGALRPLEDLARCALAGARYALHYAAISRDPGCLTPGLAGARKAARAHPRSALAQAWLGRALLDEGRLDDAGQPLAGAVRLDANQALALAWAGEWLVRAGRYQEALGPLERAAALQPSFLPARLWRAAAVLGLGRRKEAEAEVAGACAREPRGAEAIRRWFSGVRT